MTTFHLPDLPYAYDALDPHMSGEALEFHRDKHHRTYVDKTNAQLKDSSVTGDSLEEIVEAALGEDDNLFNSAAQHCDHELFWKWMTPNGGGAVPGELKRLLFEAFGSVDDFRKQFVEKGTSQFGSGWVWLAIGDSGLEVMKSPNGENPLVHYAKPVLGCDVWEHSYYLDHWNDRGAYLAAFPDHLINWEFVAELLGEKVS